MEKIAKKLTDYYMRTGLINEKDAAIYQFGWQISIEILISIIASIGIEKNRGSFNKKAGFDNFGCTGSEIKGRRTGIYNKNSLQK